MKSDQSDPVMAEGTPAQIRNEVREFYDSVGWKVIGEGLYQNARYEDLRPVSQAYIQRCHRRVLAHLPAKGRILLDAGSGPIQYPAYLEYSHGYTHRLCLDISARALKEARKRIGEHGLYVVGDVANLPFPSRSLDAVVCLHTIHHVPLADQEGAFRELVRVLLPGGVAVAVYNWGKQSSIGRLSHNLAQAVFSLRRAIARLRGRRPATSNETARGTPVKTYVEKHDARWAERVLGDLPGFEIRVWRTVSVPFLKALVTPNLGGALWLRLLYRLEQFMPHFLGRHGTYPMLIFRKPGVPGGYENQEE